MHKHVSEIGASRLRRGNISRTVFICMVMAMILIAACSPVPQLEPDVVSVLHNGSGLQGVELRTEDGEVFAITDESGRAMLCDLPRNTRLVPVLLGFAFSPDDAMYRDSDLSFTAASESLIENGEFFGVEGGMPAGWNWVGGNLAPSGTTYGVTTAESVSGDYSVFIDIPSGPHDRDNWWSRFQQDVYLPHTTARSYLIRVSFWIKTEDVYGDARGYEGAFGNMTFFDEDHNRATRIWAETAGFTGTNEWRKVEQEFIVPSGTAKIEFGTMLRHGFGRVYFADYQVEVDVLASVTPKPKYSVLTYQDSPENSVTVTWITLNPADDLYVLYSSDASLPLEQFRKQAATSHTFESSSVWVHSAKLTGLQPGIDYKVVIDHPEEPDQFFFRTASNQPEEIVFVVGGDSRTQRLIRQDINQMAAADEPEFVIFFFCWRYD